MNKTIGLVNEWGRFEERHPDADIADFCRHYLISRREKEQAAPVMGGDVPMNPNGLLLKMIGRIHKLNAYFAAKALEGTELTMVEEFGMLLTIRRLKNPRKTEIIYSNLFELSSGTDMLNRLKNRHLITESADKEDKRSKRIKLTAAGEKTIGLCTQQMQKCAGMMLAELSQEDVQLCTLLLRNVESKFADIWQEHKSGSFEEIYKAALGDKDLQQSLPVSK